MGVITISCIRYYIPNVLANISLVKGPTATVIAATFNSYMVDGSNPVTVNSRLLLFLF